MLEKETFAVEMQSTQLLHCIEMPNFILRTLEEIPEEMFGSIFVPRTNLLCLPRHDKPKGYSIKPDSTDNLDCRTNFLAAKFTLLSLSN